VGIVGRHRSQGNLDAVFKWTYHVFWGAEDVAGHDGTRGETYRQQGRLDDVPERCRRERVEAALNSDLREPPAIPWSTRTVPGGTEDFSSQIAQFKKAGAEIGMGLFIPPDFTNFWKQAAQTGYMPKIATYTKALLFPQSVEALARSPTLSTECGGRPTIPSSRTSLADCQELPPTSRPPRISSGRSLCCTSCLRLGRRRPQADYEC